MLYKKNERMYVCMYTYIDLDIDIDTDTDQDLDIDIDTDTDQDIDIDIDMYIYIHIYTNICIYISTYTLVSGYGRVHLCYLFIHCVYIYVHVPILPVLGWLVLRRRERAIHPQGLKKGAFGAPVKEVQIWV